MIRRPRLAAAIPCSPRLSTLGVMVVALLGGAAAFRSLALNTGRRRAAAASGAAGFLQPPLRPRQAVLQSQWPPWTRPLATAAAAATTDPAAATGAAVPSSKEGGGGGNGGGQGVGPVRYAHEEVEPRWQRFWEEKEVFKAVRRPGKPKKYVLDMFPYPSGAGLHVGHPEGYTASDVMARYWRMRDYDVLHPMGWDSFGLPAEQHAINTGTHPGVTTYENIANFKRQLRSLGFSYDWSRELATTDWDYVKWTQWIFLQLYKKGLAEQSEVLVNWCPALGTVLANEEVINGLSERGDHPVERIPLRQWVLKITQYAERLEADLEGLEWPEGTMTAQRLWIGRSEGARVVFPLGVGEGKGEEGIEVFTTRPDTLMGVTYVVLAPEHPLVKALTTAGQAGAVEAYVKEAAGKSDLDRSATGKDKGKTGVFTGATAVHPISGEPVPVWVADYVLWGYGTGAVMAVPAHDERDYAFAKRFGLPITQVVAPADPSEIDLDEGAFPGEGTAVNSGPLLDGKPTAEAKQAIVGELARVGRGAAVTNYRLRDWVFSRQRYWGEPIPIYFPVDMADHETGDPRKDDPHTIRFDQPIPVEESELPLKLPDMDDFAPGNDPQGCLARAKDWRYFKKDGKWFARETNTMPQWAGSCWYYLRFSDPANAGAAWGQQADQDWLPVDLYVGGQEHAVLHLLYARFWHKFLFDQGLTRHKEPFHKLVHQGMILGSDGEKMSKSRGNVVNPDDIVGEFGGDALRMYEMFMGPLEAVKPWQTAQVAGVVRFRDKLYQLVSARGPAEDAMDDETLRLMHKTIKKVTQDVDALSFNTAISAMMVFANHLWGLKAPAVPRAALETLTLLVSPFAPHLGEECWRLLGHDQTLAYHPWPEFDEALTVDDVVKLGVQVNGKTRGEVAVAPDAPQEEVVALATALDKVKGFLEGKKLVKVIYVPGRILNLVAK